MTGPEAKKILLDALDERLDEMARAKGKTYTPEARAAGREAMDAYMVKQGVDFDGAGAMFNADELRQVAEHLIRSGLS